MEILTRISRKVTLYHFIDTLDLAFAYINTTRKLKPISKTVLCIFSLPINRRNTEKIVRT